MQKFNQETVYSQHARSYGRRAVLSVVVLLCALMSTSMLLGVGGLFTSPDTLGSVALAQSQNEVQIGVVYDGTSTYDTADNVNDFDSWQGAAPQPHTPGSDAGAQNGVVRTWDIYALRVDWNINEDDATNVVLTVELPALGTNTFDVGAAHSVWNPDASGMFAGCDPALSSISGDGRTLTCHLGDQAEGSNGVIRPQATLQGVLDNTTFNVTVRMVSDGVAEVSDTLEEELTVSESPYVEYIKNEPTISDPVTDPGTGTEGRVLLYPISMADMFQIPSPPKGSGPINDAIPVTFYDHMWNITANPTVATASQMTAAGFGGRTSCGLYDGTGAFPALSGGGVSWTCGAAANGTGGYPVVQMTVGGYTSRPYPANNADGSANNPDEPVFVAGQIAVWITSADLQTEIDDPTNDSDAGARLHNSISNDDGTVTIDDTNDATEPPANGTSGQTVRGIIANNTVDSTFGEGSSSFGGGGPLISHNIMWYEGPLILATSDSAFPSPRIGIYGNPQWQGGLNMPRDPNTYFSHWQIIHNEQGEDVLRRTARGNTLTLQSYVITSGSQTHVVDAPLHGCVAFDTTHYHLTEFESIRMEYGADSYVIPNLDFG